MKFGNIDINCPLFLAPMDDVTDTSFRRICRRLGADIVISEFICCNALHISAESALKRCTFSEEERPVGIQLLAGDETALLKGLEIAEKFKPDFIDINAGCSSGSIVNRREGAFLLKDTAKFEHLLTTAIKATTLPVTVKTRLGWDISSINILDTCRMIEQAGAAALTVHCRTRSQGYKGKADWTWLEKIKKIIAIPLIGNGDARTPEDVKNLFATGCDGVMIGRECVRNPWLFAQTKHYLATGIYPARPSPGERIEICLEHLEFSVQHKGIQLGVKEIRKHYRGYLTPIPGSLPVINKIIRLDNMDEVIIILKKFLGDF